MSFKIMPKGFYIAFAMLISYLFAESVVAQVEDEARKVVVNVAGNGNPGYFGDGLAAVAASLRFPTDVVVDYAGNLYISDTYNSIIRYIAYDTGIMTTYAGTPPGLLPSDPWDNCLATKALLNTPRQIAFDSNGNLYIADEGHNAIRNVSKETLIISTYGGIKGQYWGAAGDGDVATSAVFNQPYGLVFDNHDNLYVSDAAANYIRKIDAQSGIVSTFAGVHDEAHFSWDAISGLGTGPTVTLNLNHPTGLTIDPDNNLFVADSYSNVIRKVSSSSFLKRYVVSGGSLTMQISLSNSSSAIVAGVLGAPPGYFGDGGEATQATLFFPNDVALDGSGNIYIADSGNNAVRVVTPSKKISTFAGSGYSGYNGNGIPALSTFFHGPLGLYVYNLYSLYIADTSNNLIRLVV
jgi:trimeric autotransporter adhesin